MNSFQILEAIGELDTGTVRLGLSDQKSESNEHSTHKKRIPPGWWMIASAAFLIVAVAVILTLLKNGNPHSKIDDNFRIENGILLSYTGKEEKIVLPESVVAIADYAFSEAPQLKSLTILSGVRSIGANAFAGCSKLSEILIDESNENFIEENGAVFSCDKRLLVKYFGEEDSFVIPNETLFLSGNAFSNSRVQNVVLHEKIRFIGKDCFAGSNYSLHYLCNERNDEYLLMPDGKELTKLYSSEVGSFFGNSAYDHVSAFEGIVSSYEWNEVKQSVRLTRIGDMSSYYRVTEFSPDLTGASGQNVCGNFWSKNDGMVAIGCGVMMKYDVETGEYSVTDNEFEMVGYGVVSDLFITHDGGYSWTKMPSHSPVTNQKNLMVNAQFINENVGFVTAGANYEGAPIAYLTTDECLTWNKIELAIPEQLIGGGSSTVQSLTEKDGELILTVKITWGNVTEATFTSPDGKVWTLTVTPPDEGDTPGTEPVDPHLLNYTGIYQGKSANGETFGYAGVDLAHDSTGKLYLHIPAWNQYIETSYHQYGSLETDAVRTEYQTAAVCGDYAWLIVSNGNGSNTSRLSVMRTDRQGNHIYGQIDFSVSLYLQGLYCHFDSANDGKLIVYESDQYQRCTVYETTDGGQTWNFVAGSTVSSDNSHESVRSAGFVNNQVGFVSYRYFATEQPADRTYLTFDGGKTWNKWNVTLSPEIIKDGYGEAMELTFDGNEIVLTVIVRGGSFTEEVHYRYLSDDSGITWSREGENPTEDPPIEDPPEEDPPEEDPPEEDPPIEDPTDTIREVDEYRTITGVYSINVRAERNLTSKIVATLVKDTQVHQVERITTPDGEVWAHIEFSYQGINPSPSVVSGYLKQKYLSENTVTPEPEKEDSAVMEPYDKEMLIAADNMLTIRSEPSLSASAVRTLYRGTKVHQTGLASAVDADGIQWAKVEFEDVSTDGRVTVTVGYTNVKYLSDTVENNKTYTYSKQSNTLIFNYFAGGEVTLPQDFASAFVKPMTEKSMGNMAIPYVTISKTALLCTEDKQSYYVLFSDDAGKTWTKGTAFNPSDENLSLPLSDTVFDAYLMDFQTKNMGVLLLGRGNATEGFRNLLYTTEDGGKTWTFRNEVASLGFSALSYLDNGKIVIGYVYGNGGVELHSTSDFGETFTEKLFDMTRVMINDIVKIDCIGKWNDSYFGGLSRWDETERKWQLLSRLKVQSYDGGVTWSLSGR